MPTVQSINTDSPYLADVKRLGRLHRETLGFLPFGAFDAYAKDHYVIVALDEQDQCVGYVLYRVVRDRVTIAHFCVDASVRRQGYARLLRDYLIAHTRRWSGITLSCRTDFPANAFWPRLGFSPIGTRPGRAGTLQVWWLSHGHPNLFTQENPEDALRATVDANILLDLADNRSDETKELQSDWLAPFVRLCYTDELLLELNRHPTKADRNVELGKLTLLEYSGEDFQRADLVLSPLFPDLATEQDQSDYRHLVRSVAAGAEVFVTRDGPLLERADEIYEASGLSVVRPGELITHIDTLQQEHLYRQVPLAGTNQVIQSRLMEVEDALVCATKTNSEKLTEVSKWMNRCLADPQRFACHQVTDRADAVLAAYVVDRSNGVVTVPYFRVCPGRRAATLTRTLLAGIVRGAGTGKAVIITDLTVDTVACTDMGFMPVDEGYLKIVLHGWNTVEETADLLASHDTYADRIRDALPEAMADAQAATRLEHMLWPAKLADAPISSFIVPIRAVFAEHLVDTRLARDTLFGADPDLALNPESAYYRHVRPGIIRSPGRVLWYVSQADGYDGTKSIRACSRVVEVIRGTPKPLFTRFRRLGVYDWKDVLGLAGGLDNEIMAFRFDDTELLRPMGWDEHQAILRDHGVKTNFESPIRIEPSVFGAIYTASFGPPPVR